MPSEVLVRPDQLDLTVEELQSMFGLELVCQNKDYGFTLRWLKPRPNKQPQLCNRPAEYLDFIRCDCPTIRATATCEKHHKDLTGWKAPMFHCVTCLGPMTLVRWVKI